MLVVTIRKCGDVADASEPVSRLITGSAELFNPRTWETGHFWQATVSQGGIAEGGDSHGFNLYTNPLYSRNKLG